jgi:hypothetical protein
LHKALASQTPALGTAAKLLHFHGGEGAKGLLIGSPHIHKASDALAATPAVAELSLQSIELDPFPQSHLPQILPGITLNILTFPQKTNHWHWTFRNPAILRRGQLRSVT